MAQTDKFHYTNEPTLREKPPDMEFVPVYFKVNTTIYQISSY